MALILNIETTSTNCSVGLGLEGKTIALKEHNSKQYSHSEELHLFIKEVLADAGYGLKDLNAIAVSQGPGSYTGLRIGVSAAKGLCFALNIPLIASDTMQALCAQAHENESTDYIIPMLDARRMEVYSAVFDAKQKKLEDTQAVILREKSYAPYLNQGKTIFIGTGAQKFSTICQHANAVFQTAFPSAQSMAKRSEDAFQHKTFADLAYFEPFYLKDFIGHKKP